MSKAFTKEDSNTDSEAPSAPGVAVPKHYMTPKGFATLQAELKSLLYEERPKITAVVSWAASNGDRSENADYTYAKKRLREIDKKIHQLTKKLEGAEVIDPLQVKNKSQIFFGATVTLEDEEGKEKTYSIVGIDEANPSKGKISWISPLAKALLKAKVGDLVAHKTPKGVIELEVLNIQYREIL